MFDFTKRNFRFIKNRKEIEDKLNTIDTYLEIWKKSENTTLEGTINLLSTYSTDIISLSSFPKTDIHKLNEVRFLLIFWFSFYYLKTLEDHNRLSSKSVDEVFKDLSPKLIEDIYNYPFGMKIPNTKNYYQEKLDTYFRYYNVHLTVTDDIRTEMSSTVVNLLIKDGENYKIKFLDVLKLFDVILPNFKEKILS